MQLTKLRVNLRLFKYRCAEQLVNQIVLQLVYIYHTTHLTLYTPQRSSRYYGNKEPLKKLVTIMSALHSRSIKHDLFRTYINIHSNILLFFHNYHNLKHILIFIIDLCCVQPILTLTFTINHCIFKQI